jgi:hypothetical protein
VIGATHIETTVEKANAEVVVVIGSISSYLPVPSAPMVFSIESTVEVTKERADVTKELFVGDEHWVDGALTDLEKHHILLLAGNRGCGRSTLAIYLGARIADHAHLQSTLVVGPLDHKVQIDLWKLAASEKDFARRTIVFTDAFGRRNNDLLGFFARNDAVQWEQFTTKLRASQTYLIFTVEPDSIAHFRQQASEGIICREVHPPGRDRVGRGLDLRVTWLQHRGLLSEEHVRQIAENREHLLDNLRTLPRVAGFLDQFKDSDPDLKAALHRFDDIAFWFSQDLAADVDAWCFVLTLALAHVVRPAGSVGWYELERIRRAVTERIKGDSELFPRRLGPEPNEAEMHKRTAGQSLSDDSLLRHGRAEVAKDPSRLGDVVRFIDRSYAAAIWQTLAQHHRRVLTALLPTLRAIAEDERGPGSYAVRSLAAQMVGRIGELDPFSMSMPLVQQEWVGARDRAQHPFVGRLLQGMLTSHNENYKQVAIGAVDSLMVERLGYETGMSDRLLTAISAYSLLGERELSLAMKKLGVLATTKLAPVMANLHQLEQLVERVDQHLSRTTSQQAADDLLSHRVRLGRLANQLSAQHAATLLALKQAVVYLCLTTDSVTVLCAMREWIAHGGPQTGTLVALLFLHGGIAEDLETAAANVRSLSGAEQASPIVQSLSNNTNAVEPLGAFLADLHSSIDKSSSLPAELQRELRDRFRSQLTEWARAAKDNPIHSEALRSLFVSLVLCGGALREDILALFGTRPFTEDETMADFAAEVTRKHLDRMGGAR